MFRPIYPPQFAAVFLLGIFYKRLNANGALATLVGGFLIGFGKLTLEIIKSSFTEGTLIYAIADINWLVFGAYFFALCIAIAVSVSLLYPAPSASQLKGLTFATIDAKEKAENKASYNWVDIATSVLIIAIVAYIMISFSTLNL